MIALPVYASTLFCATLINSAFSIVVLKNGIVCETNETEELFNNPTHIYTKELIKLMPKIESII